MNYEEISTKIKEYIFKHQTAVDNGDEECDYRTVLNEMVEEGRFDKDELPMKKVYETPSYDGEVKQWVFEHKNGDESIFISFKGWYSSYEGCEVESSFKQVQPYTFSETRYK